MGLLVYVFESAWLGGVVCSSGLGSGACGFEFFTCGGWSVLFLAFGVSFLVTCLNPLSGEFF